MARIISYIDKLKGARAELVYLVVAKNQGHDAWFIAEIEKTKKSIFTEAVKHEPLDLTQYGKVLYSGWGTEPPVDVTKKLEEEYAA